MSDTSFTKRLLDALHIRNYDDRTAKIGSRSRDKVSASLEGMTLSKDRWVLKGSLRNMPSNGLFMGDAF